MQKELRMDRRAFVAAVAGIPAVAEAVAAGAAPAQGERRPAQMKVGTQQGPTTDEMLQYFKRHACVHICGYPATSGPNRCATREDLERLRDRVEKHDISLDMVPLPLSSSYITRSENPSIMMGKSPERDRAIDAICEMIRNVSRAGIPAVKYNMTVLGVLRTGSTDGRGGTRYSTWDLAAARQEPPLTEAGPSLADAMWERITYFLDRVVPVANEFKVKMACHPHDPGVPPAGFRGVDRVLGTVDGLKQFIAIRESPYHGLNFCQGTVAEMLRDPGREIYDVIRYFGSRQKIFNVHFRNIRGGRDRFQEVFPDEGDVDFVKALLVYKEVGYSGMLMPDHMPRHKDDQGGLQAFAYALGYIKALIQAVDALG
jgi:mannonate dehydratase